MWRGLCPVPLDMFCGGDSYRSELGLDIHQVNVAAVEGNFVGLLGLPSARGAGMICLVLGLPSHGPDLWNFDHMDSRGPSMISETSPDLLDPTGSGDSAGALARVRIPYRNLGSGWLRLGSAGGSGC